MKNVIVIVLVLVIIVLVLVFVLVLVLVLVLLVLKIVTIIIITNIYNKYIKRIPTYLNDPNMRSFNIDESKNYSGLMDIGFIKLI